MPLTSPTPGRITAATDAQYHRSGNEQLYVVHHPPPGSPTASVLLLGPLCCERAHAQRVWVRWAQRLADAGFGVLRFDYRGTGESGGRFDAFAWSDWIDDARAAARVLRERWPGVPMLLHGLRAGAWIGRHLLHSGMGDALLEWGSPASAVDAIRDLLRYRLAEDAVREMDGSEGRIGSVEELIESLERGQPVTSEGYRFSPRLWEESCSTPTPSTAECLGRPVLSLPLAWGAQARVEENRLAPMRIPSPPFWRPGRVLLPDLQELMARSLCWIRDLPARPGQEEDSNEDGG